jgi:hypothetical protein
VKKRFARIRVLPWAALLQGGIVVRQRWLVLSDRERTRLVRLLRDSGRHPGSLTSEEREELRRLIGKLDLTRFGRDLGPVVRELRRRGV